MGVSIYVEYPGAVDKEAAVQVLITGVTYNVSSMFAEVADVCLSEWFTQREGQSIGALVVQLRTIVEKLKARPGLKKQDPDNGWGSYDDLVEKMERLLYAARNHPTAKLRSWC